ncbi:ABC-type glycerol-3-phosphate transport system permease component [Paenibacillus rhizosphaerae]|uniref:ABC-type glycerol-3-phosphate transport system permease component n=1 Tax=Paenibacillus rhizosphaerae TaxID=297318 RepID=A0A839TFK9_9BACL|nr:hypothetical protein [Paenibacillus rhizosphaerae]MBB3125372.1 ABC-type glycerol-3-phosphate transport system permease component [Paenibacillus rhizosphaerae]
MNTILYTSSNVAGVLITSIASGYAFSKLDFKGRKTIFLAYIGTMMVPSQVTIIPVFIFLSQMNWVDSWGAMMAAATMVSAPVLILFLFVQKYSIEGIAMTGIKG